MTLIKADSDAKDKSGILCDNIKKMLQGCALMKIEGSPVLWICKI